MHKTGQSGGFLGRPLGPLLETGLHLIGNVLKSLAKSVLITLRLTVAASATDAAIHKKMFGSGNTTLIRKEIKKFIGKKNIVTNIYIMQTYDSIMCGYFCIGFIDFMLKGKSLLDYTNLFSPNDYEKNDKIIPKYFQ